MPLPRQPATNRGRNASIASSLRLRLIARRSPSASPIEKPAAAIATSSTWSWKTTTPSVSRSASRSDSCSTGGSKLGIVALRVPVLHVRVHGLALDRPRADERDLHGQVVEVLGPRLQQALHLRAALDLEDADGVGRLDLRVDAGVVERHPREVDRLALAGARCGRSPPRRPRACRGRAGRSSGSRRRRSCPCPTGRSAGRPSPRAAPARGRSAAGSR